MGKVSIAVGAFATLAVGMLAAGQATSREYKPSDNTSWIVERSEWMIGRNDDTTPCREISTFGYSHGPLHDKWRYPLAEACRQEWRRAHNTYLIPDSYRGPSRTPRGIGSWR
jgi:hypothetical protein